MGEQIIQSAVIHCGDIDASGTPVYRWRAPDDITVVGIYLTGGSNIIVDPTNYHKSTVVNTGTDHLRTTTIAERDTLKPTSGATHADEIHIGIPWEVTLSDAVYLEIAEGEVLEYRPTETGTGYGDIADATLQISYYIGQGTYHSFAD